MLCSHKLQSNQSAQLENNLHVYAQDSVLRLLHHSIYNLQIKGELTYVGDNYAVPHSS